MRAFPREPSTAVFHGSRPFERARGALGAFAVAVTLVAVALPMQGAEAAYRPATTPDTIAVVDAQSTFTLLSEISGDARTSVFTFGQPGDSPVMGDWDCDGVDSPGVYRASTGTVYLRNSRTSGAAEKAYLFGDAGDIAMAGDFDGDGCDTVSIYRPTRGTAYLKNSLSGGSADVWFDFGNPGDRAFSGDWDGDGMDTVGLRRPASAQVYLASVNGPTSPTGFQYGIAGDQILSGDWDGDGRDTVAVYRSSNGMFYYRNRNSTGAGDGALFVGRGVSVVAVSGTDPESITGPAFAPDAPTANDDTERPVPSSQPPSSAPVSTGGGVLVPGFVAPPPRPVSGPISVSGESNVVIENVHVSNPGGDCVRVTNASNVTIRNSTIGPCGGEAVYLSDVDGAVVSGNYITGTGNGVLVHRSDSVRVDGNAFVDAGRNFVQFDKVNGAGSSISGNRGANELGGSNAEDLISLWQSNGTAASPIAVVGNHLRNGGPSNSGSGIMLGDGGGSHQTARNNVLIDPGQVGIGVAGGDDVTVTGNLIYSSAVPWSNVGVYTWDFGDGCGRVEISDNRVDWTAAGGYSNGFWNGGGCSLTTSGNDWNASLSPSIWD